MGRKKKYNNIPPETEKRLMELQTLYREDKTDQKVYSEFFLLLKSYARSIALQILKTKHHYLPPDRVEEVAMDATIKTIKMYLKPNWAVEKSFHPWLKFKCIESLFGPKDEERQGSLNIEVGEEGGKELLDLMSEAQGVVPWKGCETGTDSYDPVTVMFRGLNVASEEVRDCLDTAFMHMDMDEYITFECWVLLKIRQPNGFDKVMDNFRKRFLIPNRGWEEDFEACWLDLHSRLERHTD